MVNMIDSMLGLDNKIGQKNGFNSSFPRKIIMHFNSFEIHYNGL